MPYKIRVEKYEDDDDPDAIEVYTQVVEELNLVSVINAVNAPVYTPMNICFCNIGGINPECPKHGKVHGMRP